MRLKTQRGISRIGDVAQPVEHLSCKQARVGSSLTISTNRFEDKEGRPRQDSNPQPGLSQRAALSKLSYVGTAVTHHHRVTSFSLLRATGT